MEMSRAPSCIRVLILLIFQVIFLYLILIFLSQNKLEERKELLCFRTVQEYLQMKAQLRELQNTISLLKSRNVQQQPQQQQLRESKLDRPPRHKLANDLETFGELITIILYRDEETSETYLQTKEIQLRKQFPTLKVLVSNKSNATVGSQFNSLIYKVTTPYFLFLDSRHNLMEHDSDNSAGWLLHALENVPELDFVSGSILDEDRLEIPCYRMNLCNWTHSQRYEYSKSIGDLMICDNIANSFMGRTTSVERIRLHKKESPFDEALMSLSTTDFFLTAKQAGAVSGVRPEVFFQVNNKEQCKETKVQTRRLKYQSLLPFAHKHKVFRFRKPGADELDLCDRDSPIFGEDICDESVAQKIMLDGDHWAYQGLFAYPFIIKNLQYCMFQVVDFFNSKNISFEIVAGTALGTVKMRSILPWEAGDVDMGVNGYNQAELHALISNFSLKRGFTTGLIDNDGVSLLCAPPETARKIGGIVTMFITDFKNPQYIKMKINGQWLPLRRNILSNLRSEYGVNYLQHKLYRSQEFLHCKKTGHNACLPDFREKEGTLNEHFCDL